MQKRSLRLFQIWRQSKKPGGRPWRGDERKRKWSRRWEGDIKKSSLHPLDLKRRDFFHLIFQLKCSKSCWSRGLSRYWCFQWGIDLECIKFLGRIPQCIKMLVYDLQRRKCTFEEISLAVGSCVGLNICSIQVYKLWCLPPCDRFCQFNRLWPGQFQE